jgi:competence protein ComEC
VNQRPAVEAGLWPLWAFTTGIVMSCAAAALLPLAGPSWLPMISALVGAAALVGALRHPHRWVVMWAAAGVFFGLARGIPTAAADQVLASLLESDGTAIRVTAVVTSGWTPTRWGDRASIAVAGASRADIGLHLSRRATLEIRSVDDVASLPAPGSRIRVLATPRGDPARPRLIASSPKVVDVIRRPSGLHHLRQVLVDRMLTAAGTNIRRIRAAELAAALVVGRRDLLPPARVDGWRRSGLAHVLAVSGLHIGLLGGIVWLAALAAGARLRTARILVLIALPAYAILAGAPPSAVRAALMGVVYLVARLTGRALLPMAAVLVAASTLLLWDPRLVTDVGFQLTVGLTAALVRWAPAVADRLPGPRWLAAAIAVPVVAQIAALPIVIAHFRTVVPGAVAVNLLVPLLVTPLLVTAFAATFLALLWSAGGGLALTAVAGLDSALWVVGSVGRAAGALAGKPAPVLLVLLGIAGWWALRPGRHARVGVAAWVALSLTMTATGLIHRRPSSDDVVLLPVMEGLAAVVEDHQTSILLDGGRGERQAAELLADLGRRRFAVIAASHTDADHIGGLTEILRRYAVDRLVVPAWMMSDEAAAELVCTAHRQGTQVIPVARGNVIRVEGLVLEVVWPPARHPPTRENERSLVLRIRLDDQVVLAPADIGFATERILVARSPLAADVLLAPHHGSKGSSGAAFLDAVQPQLVLISAGPYTTHPHPHPETLERYAARNLPTRWPARDGLCGARLENGRWVLFP